MNADLCIAVTGLHRGENPQPGCGVIRAIRAEMPHLRVVGLAYDTMESGAYDPGLCDAVYTLPYPCAGPEAFLARFSDLLESEKIAVFIPTLDSEIESIVHLTGELKAMGVATFLPDARAFSRRIKSALPRLCKEAGCRSPRTLTIEDMDQLSDIPGLLGFPCFVKGRHYGAKLVGHESALRLEAARFAGDFGWPVLVQEVCDGPEYNIAGVGDGEGGILGMVCLSKNLRSAEGKGYGGITVHNAQLIDATRAFIRELRWRGPFELEVLQPKQGELPVILEMNPRFPAWIEFSQALSHNLPLLALRAALGEPVEPLPPCPAGRFFIRHSVDLCGDLGELGQLSTVGQFQRTAPSLKPVEHCP